jgi:hypothetical protein
MVMIHVCDGLRDFSNCRAASKYGRMKMEGILFTCVPTIFLDSIDDIPGFSGDKADFDSVNTSATGRLSFAANCSNSRVCDLMERTCRSSAADDLRQ